ncbi:uncharacterized protein N7477_000508 [Penicillium maclennaniae]|uniref:uncharacterized protein n=1 Tax=Penicillium maclennaniae TaxID=1343394 RepID=UPI00253FFA2F|nr:uncharacterized protein N7477_000508 [Penicillium maclennaniae]KAJ5684163.1 hypothetical protein N7477_000508 [Penicillium maclennaniae]
MDEGPILHQRFGKRTPTSKTTESIDEQILPSLVAQSMGKQQPVIFGSFVITAFKRWFGLNKYRVHVPWTTYVAGKLGQSPAFDASVYSLNAIFMGHAHTDTNLQRSSREMYSKALRLFGKRIHDPNQMKSRESVSITILLSLFETYSRTDPDSWARHAGGTALLMAHRGPNAHLTGFDRCLYLSFRSFIVAEAFVNDKPCIFERPEWQALIDQVRSEDMADPRVDGPIALFIDLQDRIFMEGSKVPGLLFQARRLHIESDREQASQFLALRSLQCCQALRRLSTQLRIAAAAQSSRADVAGDGAKGAFIGPVPSTFPQEIANSVLKGSDICLYILQMLLDYLACLEKDKTGHMTRKSFQGDREMSDPLPFRIVSKLKADMNHDIIPASEWCDMAAASMGLEAFEVRTCAVEDSDFTHFRGNLKERGTASSIPRY